MLKDGDKAPVFNLQDQDGKPVSLADYKGNWVVLFAYPRANTPGCTREAIAFSGLAKKFEKEGATVLGISPDSCAAQKKFEQYHKLKVPLLADVDKAITSKYGAFGEKVMYGKKVKGIIRSTFLIDPEGKVAKAWTKVKVDGHAEKVLEALKELKG
ncbi:MAG: peroxiredoxin [Planctomycetes bacterium]|nr:peroxiredoxin [Planctomycetota bacterium]